MTVVACVRRVRALLLAIGCVVAATVAGHAWQVPKPFPQPAQPRPTTPTTQAPPSTPAAPPSRRPPLPAAQQGTQPTTPLAGQSSLPVDTPSEATLGVPIYPTAQFVTSYDAGRGQRFYLFGVNAPFAELVTYYRTSLKSRGEVLFDTPPTHQFELARFRDETMAFPPSVTVKDYTWGGSAGYPNPKAGAQPARFATIIQVVPAPPLVP